MPVDPINSDTPVQPLETQEIPKSNLHEKIVAPQDTGYSLVKKVKYEASLGWAELFAKEWWSKIGPHELFLGGLPLKNKSHLEQIKALGVTHVISMVEPFELEPGWHSDPVQKADWAAAGIIVIEIPAPDFTPLTSPQFERGIYLLTSLLQDPNNKVYLHCKRGVGRSASIAVAYLMEAEGLSFEEAHAYVKQYRSEINLNVAQKQAIYNHFNQQVPKEPTSFEKATAVTEEFLAKHLVTLLDFVIDGASYNTSLQGWVPSPTIESTEERKERYLKEFAGHTEAAVTVAIERSHTGFRKAVTAGLGFIPYVGAPTSYSFALWHQLREVALIAALYGHDLKDESVRRKIIGAILAADARKVPAVGVDLIAKEIIRQMLLNAGITAIGIPIPAHVIYNYVTDNSAKVSRYAKEAFGPKEG